MRKNKNKNNDDFDEDDYSYVYGSKKKNPKLVIAYIVLGFFALIGVLLIVYGLILLSQ